MNLTVALSILGAVVLAALLLHGWWSARRASPRRAEAPAVPPQRVEPALGDALPGAADSVPPDAPERRAPPAVPAIRRQARLDALIDAIVPLSLDAPVSGELVLAHWPATRRAGTKPFAIEGLNTETGEWETPLAQQRYSELQAGVQVMAQPPGKKNSTIHLLSGGEKALTAIALVFAIFQLNPAPFCLLDEVDAPLDDANTERYSNLVKEMAVGTQFLFISHNKIAMEMAEQLIGVTMQEQGVSRIVTVDMPGAMRLAEAA